MNESIVKGKWKEIKGEIQKHWGNLTGDELDKAEGNFTAISGIIQQKYGHQKEDVGQRLQSIYSKFGEKIDDWKREASDGTEDFKQDLKDSDRH